MSKIRYPEILDDFHMQRDFANNPIRYIASLVYSGFHRNFPKFFENSKSREIYKECVIECYKALGVSIDDGTIHQIVGEILEERVFLSSLFGFHGNYLF